MTDDRSLEIERQFDGEPAGAGPDPAADRPADDPEARRHLDRLAILRDLARRHDPASKVPRRAIDLDKFRRRAPRRLAAASIAAALALLCWPRGREGEPPARPSDLRTKIGPASAGLAPTDRPSPATDRPPLEVELYGWANDPSRAPGQAARLVLTPASPSRKRSPADEILALELANATPKARGNVRRFVVSRGPRAASPARLPAPSPKSRAI